MKKLLLALSLVLAPILTGCEQGVGEPQDCTIAFTASWCAPCLNDKKFYKYVPDLVVVDADERPDIIQQFQITGLPTYVVLRNGVEVFRTDNIQDLISNAQHQRL